MTATTQTAAGTTARPATLPGPVTATGRLRFVLRAMVLGLRPMIVGYWCVVLLAFSLGGVLLELFTGDLNSSMWDYGTQSPKYFSAAVGITLTPALFTLLIAHGVTRRMFAVAGSIFLLGAAASTSLIWTLAYQVERGIYDWAGLQQVLTNPHLFTKTSQAGLMFVEFFLLILSHEAAGWLIGGAFYRFGFWKGVAFLPLGLLPAAAAEFLLVAQWMADALANTGYHRPPLAVGIPGILAVNAIALYCAYLLIRPMALKPTKG